MDDHDEHGDDSLDFFGMCDKPSVIRIPAVLQAIGAINHPKVKKWLSLGLPCCPSVAQTNMQSIVFLCTYDAHIPNITDPSWFIAKCTQQLP